MSNSAHCPSTQYHHQELSKKDSVKYKLKRTNNLYDLYERLHRRCKTGPSAECARGMKLYPNGTCIPVGPEEHASNYCYIRYGVKPPYSLVTKVGTVVNIKEEMEDMTDKLTQEYKEGRSLKDISMEVKKFQDPYIMNGTPFIGLTEREVRNRITQIQREMYQGNTMVSKCKQIHSPLDEEETSFLQWSGSFYDPGAAKMQQMMVLSCFALMNLFSSADVST